MFNELIFYWNLYNVQVKQSNVKTFKIMSLTLQSYNLLQIIYVQTTLFKTKYITISYLK